MTSIFGSFFEAILGQLMVPVPEPEKKRRIGFTRERVLSSSVSSRRLSRQDQTAEQIAGDQIG